MKMMRFVFALLLAGLLSFPAQAGIENPIFEYNRIGVGFDAPGSGGAGTPPSNTVLPAISGTLIVGETLTCSSGTWDGDAVITYAYQWYQSDDDAIGGATNNTYALTSGEYGIGVYCEVTATNGVGSDSAVSATTANIGDGSLKDVISSAVFDLDATKSASYSGSGTTWSNLVLSPADASAQTAYDFYTGDGVTSTKYPTFTGSAGSAAAYWAFDGGDNFYLKSGTNTTFLNTLHKTTGGSDWWAAFTFRMADDGGIGFKFWGTSTGGSAVYGIADQLTSGDLYRSQQRGAASSLVDSTATLSNGTDYIVISSHSHSGNTTRFWISSTTAESKAHTYSTITNDAAYSLKIASNGLGTQQFLPNGSRMYSFAMGNEYLDNTKAAAIIAHLESRHGRDYTP